LDFSLPTKLIVPTDIEDCHGWEHSGLTGDYVWSTADQPPTGTLRPLRQRQSLLDRVATPTWIEAGMRELAAPSVKQRLAAIRQLFDWVVTGEVVPVNPAGSVRGPDIL
jgi:hypothetical protein